MSACLWLIGDIFGVPQLSWRLLAIWGAATAPFAALAMLWWPL
jgi:hypothetical protein